MGLNIIILAAGQGSRMKSDTPKVMHKIAGIPMLERVVRTAQSLSPKKIQVVYGNGGSIVHEALAYLPVEWVKQEHRLGTGHAVLQALPFVDDEDQVLVLLGDVPLISKNTLALLAQETPTNGLGLVVTELSDPSGLGRIIRNEMGNIIAIVEHRDANEQQLKVKEINTGIMITSAKHLKSWLPKLDNKNIQGEYYLTDIVGLAVQEGFFVGGVMAHCQQEVQGVNDRLQLANLEHYFQQEKAKQLALSGVTIMDMNRVYIRGDVVIAQDVTLDTNVMIEGQVSIDSHSSIGPNVIIRDSKISSGVQVGAHSIIEGAVIGPGCKIGPFARLRPGTVLEPGVKIGNFVEVKQSHLGENTKASHLSYIGDAEIGAGVNIGAGTITCNYDGVNKHQTKIGDGVFIGSNTALVAPVKLGAGATIGAGSVITRSAPKGQLTVARAKQCSVDGWQRPEKQPAIESTS